MKVLKITVFAGAHYALIELDDKRQTELRSEVKLTEQQWIDRAKALPPDPVAVEPAKDLLEATDDELIAEVKRRDITQDKIYPDTEVVPK